MSLVEIESSSLLLDFLLRLGTAVLEPILSQCQQRAANRTTSVRTYIDFIERDVQGLCEAFLCISVGLILLLVMGF